MQRVGTPECVCGGVVVGGGGDLVGITRETTPVVIRIVSCKYDHVVLAVRPVIHSCMSIRKQEYEAEPRFLSRCRDSTYGISAEHCPTRIISVLQ